MKPKELPHELPDAETCNPKICKWCKYSTNGKRNAGRSITMCDGCRYNEEFEHIQVFDTESPDNESKEIVRMLQEEGIPVRKDGDFMWRDNI